MELGRECLEIWGYKRVDELIWVKVDELIWVKGMGGEGIGRYSLDQKLPLPVTKARTLASSDECFPRPDPPRPPISPP